MQSTQVLECCKQSLMGDCGRNSKDQKTDRNVESKVFVHEALDGNEDSIINWIRSHLC
jgi:hypothetical protein